ncbi:hypothetical protein CHS0354_008811 [Potamilus streckersoni]|uniref:Uncharacterized protein n=1 Tax=Potamilus streckersoni TaxID=2493646 RepID=A0AAE0SPF7_9BIVA|nr:hypothetical protein CHS0354_008811 [Potamilus streckersoni]
MKGTPMDLKHTSRSSGPTSGIHDMVNGTPYGCVLSTTLSNLMVDSTPDYMAPNLLMTVLENPKQQHGVTIRPLHYYLANLSGRPEWSKALSVTDHCHLTSICVGSSLGFGECGYVKKLVSSFSALKVCTGLLQSTSFKNSKSSQVYYKAHPFKNSKSSQVYYKAHPFKNSKSSQEKLLYN